MLKSVGCFFNTLIVLDVMKGATSGDSKNIYDHFKVQNNFLCVNSVFFSLAFSNFVVSNSPFSLPNLLVFGGDSKKLCYLDVIHLW